MPNFWTASETTQRVRYDARLRRKREVYVRETGTRNAIHLTMISANGVKRNANWNDIQSEVTLDDLFL